MMEYRAGMVKSGRNSGPIPDGYDVFSTLTIDENWPHAIEDDDTPAEWLCVVYMFRKQGILSRLSSWLHSRFRKPVLEDEDFEVRL